MRARSVVVVTAVLAALGCSPGEQVLPAPEVPAVEVGAPNYYDVSMAVSVLTEPDVGSGGFTMRWEGSDVTFRVRLPGYPARYVAKVRNALRWGGQIAGLKMVETEDVADIEVVPRSGNGALVSAWTGHRGQILHVLFELGCCRLRPLWEDSLQSFGPMGDRADERSVFSQDSRRLVPSKFDAWVLRSLYSMPSGSSAAAAGSVLAAMAPQD